MELGDNSKTPAYAPNLTMEKEERMKRRSYNIHSMLMLFRRILFCIVRPITKFHDSGL